MSANLLRQAATILRERAEKATPGPWDCEHSLDEHIHVNAGTARTEWRQIGPEGRTRVGKRPSSWKTTDRIVEYDADPDFEEPADIEQRESDADYIATMHPGVGLALAEWLSDHADDHDAYDCQWPSCSAIDLARLIVGGDA